MLLDQISKFIVKKSMYLYESIEVIGDFFRLTYIENPGMAFGIQLESKFLFTFLSSLNKIFESKGYIVPVRIPEQQEYK